jgi:ribonuclease HII
MPLPRRSSPPDAEILLLPGFDPPGDPARELEAALGPSAQVAGIDEVGRGPLAGPVVAAAVVLDRLHGIDALDDSKVLDEAAREGLYPIIMSAAAAVGIGVVEAPRIDEINILQASLEAMRLAFERCEQALGSKVRGAVVDGHMRAPLPERVAQRAIIKGDARSAPIMAASIVAKVTRDRRMVKESLRFPAYGFEQHKGYPTPAHKERLRQHGPCSLHRRSFAPVREAEEATAG